MLKGKKILVGVCGGIAAYKICYLVRELKQLEADVKVVMTSSATKFISPLTFSTLSANEVVVDMFPGNRESGTALSVNHINLAVWADVIIIAPATANTIAKVAHGFADNLLTTIILAARSPVLFAPSMDVDMYENKITRENLSKLKELGFSVIEPESGFLASGLIGKGRLPEISKIVGAIESVLNTGKGEFIGKKVLITAGPTQEFIDPVRFISNRSSGKMGYALAKAFSLRGADVILISGPVHLAPPEKVKTINVRSSDEMFDAVKSAFKDSDIIIMAAAVADFRPEIELNDKIKKDQYFSDSLTIKFQKTTDILNFLGKNKRKQFLIGFALDTSNEIENAEEKLLKKNLDMIVLNNPLIDGAGFDVDTNVVSIITRDGKIEKIDKKQKIEVANIIIDKILNLKSSTA